MKTAGRSWTIRGVFFGLCGLMAVGLAALDQKEYKVIIITDTVGPWAVGIRDGFRETLDKQLAIAGAKASYQVFDTRLDSKTIPDIQAAIDKTKPNLICTINYPSVFADNMITKNPANSGYNFVSENCIPIQSGLIKDMKRPGGNVTGVGVFTQMNSMVSLAKMINPKVTKMAVSSWDAMTQVNEWFEAEFKRACKEEGIELVEFRRVSYFEDLLAFLTEYDQKGNEYFVADGIGAAVHKDGSRADTKTELLNYAKNLKHLLYLGYDEDSIKSNGIKTAGTSVIWYDIGAQLADKAMKIFNGAKPGDLPWDYPRKFNMILNKAVADKMGFTFSPKLVGAAYRVYTDLDGHFSGKAN